MTNFVMIEATVDRTAWKVELERVRPRLTLNKAKRGGWRERVGVFRDGGAWGHENVSGVLGRVVKTCGDEREEVMRREAQLNTQLEEGREVHQAVEEERLALGARVEEMAEVTSGLTADMASVDKLNEEVKNDIDSSVHDTTNSKVVVEAKKAVAALKLENNELELRLGLSWMQLTSAEVRSAECER